MARRWTMVRGSERSYASVSEGAFSKQRQCALENRDNESKGKDWRGHAIEDGVEERDILYFYINTITVAFVF